MGIPIKDKKATGTETRKRDQDGIWKKEISIFGKSFPNKKKEHFYEEISVLIKSGVNLKQALDLVEESQSGEKDKKLIGRLNKSILKGSSFSAAMKSEQVFTPFEYHAVRIGEQTGQLTFIMQDLADYFQRMNEQRRQVISSMTYPVIVLFTALVVVFFMLKYVVPMFEDIFHQNKVHLPFLTQMIVNFSHFIEENGLLLFVTLLGVVIGIKVSIKKEWFKKLSGILILRLPFIGQYTRKIFMARFTHTMMLLTNSKIPIVVGLSMVRQMIQFFPLQSSLKAIEEDIIQGSRISASFQRHTFFDKKMIALLKVAEETNQTEFVFKKLYEQYSREVAYQSKTITNILNPFLTLLVGFLVGVILVAMYLPMFRLSSVLG